jgi:hypothetical protein
MAHVAKITTTDVASNRQATVDSVKTAAIPITAVRAIATSMVFSTAERIDMSGAYLARDVELPPFRIEVG